MKNQIYCIIVEILWKFLSVCDDKVLGVVGIGYGNIEEQPE